MLIQALICILKTDLYMKNNLNLEREIGKKREISLFPSSLENRVKMWVRAQSGNREGNLYI